MPDLRSEAERLPCQTASGNALYTWTIVHRHRPKGLPGMWYRRPGVMSSSQSQHCVFCKSTRCKSQNGAPYLARIFLSKFCCKASTFPSEYLCTARKNMFFLPSSVIETGPAPI
ncbi:hypothetical protein KCU74_g63, partial [Aureobasidium melanogenum]